MTIKDVLLAGVVQAMLNITYLGVHCICFAKPFTARKIETCLLHNFVCATDVFNAADRISLLHMLYVHTCEKFGV